MARSDLKTRTNITTTIDKDILNDFEDYLKSNKKQKSKELDQAIQLYLKKNNEPQIPNGEEMEFFYAVLLKIAVAYQGNEEFKDIIDSMKIFGDTPVSAYNTIIQYQANKEKIKEILNA